MMPLAWHILLEQRIHKKAVAHDSSPARRRIALEQKPSTCAAANTWFTCLDVAGLPRWS